MIEHAYRRFCTKRFALPTDKQVKDLETRIGVELPDDFRRFLFEYNGGYFAEPQIVPPVAGCPIDCLTFLCGIDAPDPIAEIGRERDLLLFDDNVPCQVLPIGDTLMGNLLLLITHPEDRGCVGLKRAFSDDCFFLAEGIDEFFTLLREPET